MAVPTWKSWSLLQLLHMKILCAHSRLVDLRKYFCFIFYISKYISVWMEISFAIRNIITFFNLCCSFLKN